VSDKKRSYRSAAWFAKADKDGFGHRSWMRNQGLPSDVFDGRPVIGICNTWSELTPCYAHFRQIAERVKRGVWEAGGLPLEFPVMSLGESIIRPTAMLFRNLVSMDVEESIRANPIDGVVLLCGCDKTTPSLVMGAANCDVPALVVSGGPMLNGKYRGQDIGSGTAMWRFSEEVKAGTLSQQDFMDAEACMSCSAGHCMTMGTASTMACMVEALGLALPHNAAIPAVDSRRLVLAHIAGRRIVEMVRDDLRIARILTRHAFENAIHVNGAVGGSTNAVIHLLAIAGRVGLEVTLDDWDNLGREVPTLVDLMPSGRFLMEDFYYAGGLPAVIRALGERNLIHRDALTVNGKTIWENCQTAANWNTEVIRSLENPLVAHGANSRATRQFGAGWRRAQAFRGFTASHAASRPRDRLREYRALQGTHRRSRVGRGRALHSGTEELRPERLSRNGRGRQYELALKGVEARNNRHGTHFKCAHERHRLRNGRASCLSGSRSRWKLGFGGGRRLYRTGRGSPAGACQCFKARIGASTCAMAAAGECDEGGYVQLYLQHCRGFDPNARRRSR